MYTVKGCLDFKIELFSAFMFYSSQKKEVKINWNSRLPAVNLPPLAASGRSTASSVASVECEHRVNFSGTAAAQRRLMGVRYAEAIGGGLIDDWSLSVRQSLGSQLGLAYISG